MIDALEIWKSIPGWSLYQASSLGRIRNSKTGYVLSPGKEPRGYLSVCLYCERPAEAPKMKIKKSQKVHKLVCLAFHGLPPVGHEVCHNDGNRSNNVPPNLRWGTRFDNAADKKRHGTDVDLRGSKNNHAKLNETNIIQIRADPRALDLIADNYGISVSYVGRIKKFGAWKHIPLTVHDTPPSLEKGNDA
jgi:HNH endonuclease/NUMOD4 motif